MRVYSEEIVLITFLLKSDKIELNKRKIFQENLNY